MTPGEIKRYLALPEEFRHNGVYMTGDGVLCDRSGYWRSADIKPLAIASMLVGLRKAGYAPQLQTRTDDTVRCSWFDEDMGWICDDGPSDFLALLSACESVEKNRGEA